MRNSNPAWGVRELDQVIAVAANHDLKLLEVVQMPANNLSVIFQRENFQQNFQHFRTQT